MARAYPPDSKQHVRNKQECFEEPPRHGEDCADGDRQDRVTSLLEENARLRALVVSLTDLVLRNVADRG